MERFAAGRRRWHLSPFTPQKTLKTENIANSVMRISCTNSTALCACTQTFLEAEPGHK